MSSACPQLFDEGQEAVYNESTLVRASVGKAHEWPMHINPDTPVRQITCGHRLYHLRETLPQERQETLDSHPASANTAHVPRPQQCLDFGNSVLHFERVQH